MFSVPISLVVTFTDVEVALSGSADDVLGTLASGASYVASACEIGVDDSCNG